MAISNALKAQLVTDIEQTRAEFMKLYGSPLYDIVVPCPLDDVEEVQLLLDCSYPESGYRAVEATS